MVYLLATWQSGVINSLQRRNVDPSTPPASVDVEIEIREQESEQRVLWKQHARGLKSRIRVSMARIIPSR